MNKQILSTSEIKIKFNFESTESFQLRNNKCFHFTNENKLIEAAFSSWPHTLLLFIETRTQKTLSLADQLAD